MDELDTSLNRLSRAVAEIEKACIARENDVKARQQDLFAGLNAATPAPKVPEDLLVKTLDGVINNIQFILNRKEAA